MNLIEALQLVRNHPAEGKRYRVSLVSGFTPLHLQTFLAAHLIALHRKEKVEIIPGLFGDLAGNLERLQPDAVDAVAVFLEWSDLDARLGLRALGGWKPADLPGILRNAGQQLARLEVRLAQLSQTLPVVLSLPTLPLPPLSYHPTDQDGAFATELRENLGGFAARNACLGNLKIVSSQLLDLRSPLSGRLDVRSEIESGFPYRKSHASVLAGLFAGLLRGPSPKKGLITDLDDTLWAGILGEAGVGGVSWDLDSHSHIHGMYQQMLESLASAGILLAVASKNDPLPVHQAFDRKDILIQREHIFPFEVNWHAKSKSVARILEAWNVGPEAVVFIDDSPLEIAEVQSAFPEIECRLFPRGDPDRVWLLLNDLRQAFGKPHVAAEDSIRLESLRTSGAMLEAASADGNGLEAFLASAEARIRFELSCSAADTRAFELINKTNQFNLNGERFTPSRWAGSFAADGAFLLTATYQDKFGPLGKIAALLGKAAGKTVHVDSWVMSCRAFSRQIEHQTLHHLFERFDAHNILLAYQPTARNGPIQDFLELVLPQAPSDGMVHLRREEFLARSPRLCHKVESVDLDEPPLVEAPNSGQAESVRQ